MWHGTFVILAYLAMVVQTAWPEEAAIRGLNPDFLALLLAGGLFVFERRGSLVWAAIAGFLVDCLAPGRMGIGMFVAVLIALVFGKLIAPRADRPAMFVAFLTFVMVLLFSAAVSAARTVLAGQPVAVENLIVDHSIIAAYSALVGLVLLLGWRPVRRLVPRAEQSSAIDLTR